MLNHKAVETGIDFELCNGKILVWESICELIAFVSFSLLDKLFFETKSQSVISQWYLLTIVQIKLPYFFFENNLRNNAVV